MLKKQNGKKTITLILMMFAMCTIYILPYLRYSYYTPLQEAMGLVGNNAAYGTLGSVYGIANIILYLPGGWIADKFDSKKLMVFSMISTGALGFWMSTWPSYNILLLIFVLFGFTTVLTFWSSSVKCVNMLADTSEQGSTFGTLEAGRNIINLAIVSVFLALYTAFAADGNKGITLVVQGCSLIMIAVGVALGFLMPKTAVAGSTNAGLLDSVKAMGRAFKMPVTYVLAALIFSTSLCGNAGSYYAPYLQEGAGMSVVVTTAFANYRGVVCGVIGAVLAAFLAKKAGRSTKVIMGAASIMIVCFLLIVLLPPSAAMMWPLLTIMVIATLGQYVFRSLYYAIIDEAGSPKNVVGSVVGIASLLGFLPDAFFSTLCGTWLDNHGIAGYRYIYTCCVAAVLVLGLGCSYLGDRMVKKHQAESQG